LFCVRKTVGACILLDVSSRFPFILPALPKLIEAKQQARIANDVQYRAEEAEARAREEWKRAEKAEARAKDLEAALRQLDATSPLLNQQ
jgi:hypothetical protein